MLNLEDLCRLQVSRSRNITLIAPSRDLWWATASWRRLKPLIEQETTAETDLCAHGMRDPEAGLPIKMRLRLGGNFEWGEKVLKNCPGHGKTAHRRATGKLKNGVS